MNIYLSKQHDPSTNAKLIKELGYWKQGDQVVWQTTNKLLKAIKKYPIVKKPLLSAYPAEGVLKKGVNLLAARPARIMRAYSLKGFIGEDRLVYPEWKKELDEQYEKMLQQQMKVVDVTNFGARGDGKTDCTKAFHRALGRGKAIVKVPAGTYVVRGIKLPSWTMLIGEGKGKTIIKLHDDAPKRRRLITNANHMKGNRNIYVESMSLDWNVERLKDVNKTASGNNLSSCLTYANVMFGWVKHVEAINPGLHGFDVSSTLYNYSGDGYWAKGPSKYIWLDNLNGYGFGDDGVTTHHSENILISNSHMCDPSGRAHNPGVANSNGFEVDDGSRNVWLQNNSSTRCFGGVEVKAHHNSSAAMNTVIFGHISIKDNRSYNLRHIGHHHQDDPASKTAYDIRLANIISITPVYTDLYRESTPRAMVISAYRNVAVNNFTVIGDRNYDYKKNPVIAVQYRARHVSINNVRLTGFRTAKADIEIFGGAQRADDVRLCNVTTYESAPDTIEIGAGVQQVEMMKIY
ncbi:glycosyl hydrolase family 28-related protein [Sediminibacillus massiliensis]|uniref:glycosyl hydrolase family 28-related protein n=1 Tax=Sediminibacillus massiliensis TaxID=1926277 RepID=UPI0009886E94|nr:glycosyl hydrolase family 28-related protein [Sediminibacillus massiliensis]